MRKLTLALLTALGLTLSGYAGHAQPAEPAPAATANGENTASEAPKPPASNETAPDIKDDDDGTDKPPKAADKAPADMPEATKGADKPEAAEGGTKAVPDPDSDLAGYFDALVAAGKSSNWKLLAILIIIGLVFAVRKFGGTKIPFLQTDRGGALTVLVLGIAGAFATSFAADAPITLDLIRDGLLTGIEGAGGFVIVKRLFWPSDQKSPPADTSAEPA